MKKAGMLDKPAAMKLADSLGRRIATATLDLQKVAISAIGYANIHGDITIAQRVLEVMGTSMRRQTMVRYFEIHGKLAWDKESKTVVFAENVEALDDPAQLYETLSVLPWYEAVQEQIESILDVTAIAAKLLKRIAKAAKDGKEIKAEGKLAEALVALAKGEAELNVTADA